MTTIIKITKNKPAFRALIRIAKELEKADHASISIVEQKSDHHTHEIIMPQKPPASAFAYFDQLQDFPTIEQIRKQAWPEI
jgi:hypothetical protein